MLEILLGIGTAVVVGALGAATKIICDELSDAERRKQEAMREEFLIYKLQKQREYNLTVQFYNNKREKNIQYYNDELTKYQEDLLKKKKKTNKKIYDSYLNSYNEWYSQKVKIVNGIKSVLDAYSNNREKLQNSYLRYRSLRQTELLTTEGYYKSNAYLQYLENWKNSFEKLYLDEGEILEPFDFKLPDDYPYLGKLMYFNKSDFEKKENGYFIILPSYSKPVWLNIPEIDLFNSTSDEKPLPFMISTLKDGKFIFSLTKGLIKRSIGGTEGIKAQVLKHYSNAIRLGIGGLKQPGLFLPKKELKNKNSRNPIGSTMQLFVVDYDFALQNKITLSEKMEEGFNIENFDKILMIESKKDCDELKELYEYLIENRLLQEEDEWKIAPLFEQKKLVGLKMQQGNNYAFRVSFDNSFGENHTALRYDGLITNRDDYITFDDMFVTANVCVEAVSSVKVANNINKYESVFEECGRLILYLSTEFTKQRRIIQKTPMSHYLRQWEEVTERLIENKKFSNTMVIQVRNYESNGELTYLTVNNELELQNFLKRQNDSTRYFITLLQNDKKQIVYILPPKNDNHIIIKYSIDDQILINNDFQFNLYSQVPLYAEQQQLSALTSFRNGMNSSDSVKAAVLNIEATEYIDNGQRVQSFFNTSIYDNEAQKDAIIRAFASKDFFIIQGPPGTGKTTVIKELIFQQLSTYPHSRILVVSQANVAVDNVIRGIFVQKIISENQIIRCGTEEKLADDILPFSFDKKIEEYKNNIGNIKDLNSIEKTLSNNWISLLEDNEENNIIGEYLLKQYQIIGATCVGLENRKYGLSDIEFDLVIIDEAGKALPGELLIPINHAKKIILIGDHKQLPPVIDTSLYQGGSVEYDDVVSQEERENFLGDSFFYRLYEKCPETLKCMLNIQFRMPPVIANLVNLFYDNQLKTGENCYKKEPLFLNNNLIFIDMKDDSDYKEINEYKSVINEKECEVLIQVVARISEFYKQRVVVITPYLGQKRKLSQKVKAAGFNNVYVNTIDALQGDEEDIVIYCTTRAVKPTKYFSDAARLNVAFSRTKNTLIFIGSSKYFYKYEKDHIMRKIGNYILKNAKITSVNDWLSTSFDLLFCPKEKENTKNNTAIKENNLKLQINNDFFEKLSIERESKTKKVCLYCSKELEDWEENLCSNCINKVIIKICPGCKKEIRYPFYDKYIRKIPEPIHCMNCKIVNCSKCGKEFIIPEDKYNKLKISCTDLLCDSCFLLIRCEICGEKLRMSKEKYEELKSKGKEIMCYQCFIEKTQKVGAGLYGMVNCDMCENSFIISQDNYKKLQFEGKSLLCINCRRKKYLNEMEQ